MDIEGAKQFLIEKGYCVTKLTDRILEAGQKCAEGYENDDYMDCMDCPANQCILGLGD